MFSTKNRIEIEGLRPEHCVWEFTLACNLRCMHCGSRAGKMRLDELSTQESLDIISQLSKLGCEVVTLTGGEPTLRKDWYKVARTIHDSGMLVNMVTNGYDLDKPTVRRMKHAGLVNVAVSLDGTEKTHDRIRGKGSYERTLQALDDIRNAGVKTAVLTTVNSLNIDELYELHDALEKKDVNLWRFQLARPIGNMKKHRDLVIQPEDLLHLLPTICDLKDKSKADVGVGDCIGYHSIYDAKLRALDWKGEAQYWSGCQAGRKAMGIESNGNVKGCLSIQPGYSRDEYVEGNIRTQSLASIWFDKNNFTYNRSDSNKSLKGYCKKCTNNKRCRGGAKCMALSVTGKMQGSPYCYYRVSQLVNQQHDPVVRKQVAATAASLLMLWGFADEVSANEFDAGIQLAGGSKAGRYATEETNLTQTSQKNGLELASEQGTCEVPALPPACGPVVLYGVTPPQEISQLTSKEETTAVGNSINGRLVFTEKGKLEGLAGAKITLSAEAIGVSEMTTTDSNGYFSFLGVPTWSQYQLVFAKDGFETITLDNVWACEVAADLPACEMVVEVPPPTYRFPWSLFLPAINKKE